MHRRILFAFALAIFTFAASACGDAADSDEEDGDERTCLDDDFVFEDRYCPDSNAQPDSCQEVGDGQCYARCSEDADCTESDRPHCSIKGLFAGGSTLCTSQVRICRAEESNDCAPSD